MYNQLGALGFMNHFTSHVRALLSPHVEHCCHEQLQTVGENVIYEHLICSGFCWREQLLLSRHWSAREDISLLAQVLYIICPSSIGAKGTWK